MTTLFISDLHLDSTRPQITALFQDFLRGEARNAEALYILGDLFEAWIGDDDPEPHHAGVIAELHAMADSGVPLYFMHGNRDFLIGGEFARRAGCTLLPDPTPIDLYGAPTLLLHGDTLCTDDLAYQEFRRMVRDPVWQREFLAQPLAARRVFAERARATSQSETRQKAETIMDVNPDAVVAVMREHGTPLMIHGHTHRPAVHEFTVDEQPATRIVLGDWYEQGSVLRCTDEGRWLQNLPLDKSNA